MSRQYKGFSFYSHWFVLYICVVLFELPLVSIQKYLFCFVFFFFKKENQWILSSFYIIPYHLIPVNGFVYLYKFAIVYIDVIKKFIFQ